METVAEHSPGSLARTMGCSTWHPYKECLLCFLEWGLVCSCSPAGAGSLLAHLQDQGSSSGSHARALAGRPCRSPCRCFLRLPLARALPSPHHPAQIWGQWWLHEPTTACQAGVRGRWDRGHGGAVRAHEDPREGLKPHPWACWQRGKGWGCGTHSSNVRTNWFF